MIKYLYMSQMKISKVSKECENICKGENMDILFLEPIFKEAIWGGNLLWEFGYNVKDKNVGECWGISAHKNGDCRIVGGKYSGKTLSWLWDNNRELFGNMEGDAFPLLIKIIGAEQDLSIQVHPNDEYAAVNERGALGKTECWYILDCREGADIVIGHNAKDKEELKAMIGDERWSDLINVIPIKKGDFFQIEPGCLHAIRGGTLLIETQQNSDITYRVYDYDRLQNGKSRELHLKQSIECINAPHNNRDEESIIIEETHCRKTRLVSCDYYTLEKWEINDDYMLKMDKPFINVSVIEGWGSVNGKEIGKGMHFIIPNVVKECRIEGNMTLIISYC